MFNFITLEPQRISLYDQHRWRTTVAAVQVVSSMSTVITNTELKLPEDLTWRANVLSGHMKQLYKNVNNIF